jgi:glyoxylate/hydroxypyruvate reductase A
LQARERQWTERPPRRKADYPVGVLGFGVLGSVVAATLIDLGFTVSAWSRERKQADGVRMYAGDAELNDFLAGTRMLICLLPLTPATRGILNRKTFATLQPGNYIVNVARGGHLVESDLVEAIASGRIAGATLDVFEQEPLDPASPLWDLPQVRITPHISAATLRSESVQQIARKLQSLEEGRSISGVIDMTRGY